MSFYNTQLVMLYGGGANLTNINTQQTISVNNQGQGETVAAGSTVRRLMPGPNVGGRYSLQVFVDSAGGATSAMTVWYSNLTAPSTATDADWSQDLTIGTIDLTVTGSKFFNVGNVDAEYVMVKAAAVTTGTNVRAVIRVEGTTHGPGVDA